VAVAVAVFRDPKFWAAREVTERETSTSTWRVIFVILGGGGFH